MRCGTHGCKRPIFFQYSQVQLISERLSDCSHIFCQDCLLRWFATLHAKYMETHPDYDVGTTPGFTTEDQIRRFPPGIHPFFKAANNLPRPAYSCPACRCIVTRVPIKALHIRNLVQAMQKDANGKSLEEFHGEENANEHIWGEFFGRKRS